MFGHTAQGPVTAMLGDENYRQYIPATKRQQRRSSWYMCNDVLPIQSPTYCLYNPRRNAYIVIKPPTLSYRPEDSEMNVR